MNKTRVARSILRALNEAHMPINRQEIARSLGKRYLMRHDIKTLNRLIDLDLVAGVKRVRWEVIDERMAYTAYGNRRPDIHSDISNGSVAWWYEITPEGSQVIRKADRWLERPATIPRRSTISAGDQRLAISAGDQRSTINMNDQQSAPAIKAISPGDQSLDFDFDFGNDIPTEFQIAGEEIEVIESSDDESKDESIVGRVMNKLEWFLSQK